MVLFEVADGHFRCCSDSVQIKNSVGEVAILPVVANRVSHGDKASQVFEKFLMVVAGPDDEAAFSSVVKSSGPSGSCRSYTLATAFPLASPTSSVTSSNVQGVGLGAGAFFFLVAISVWGNVK